MYIIIENMELTTIKKVHFVGLGGIGVSAIARLMLAQNKIVSGSDVAESEIIEDLKNKGVKFFKDHQKENLAEDVDLVIYSPAVQEDNPERVKAKELGIKQLSYPEFLGELSKDKYTIAVSGTNGKSTTTAMLGLILEKAGLDPTVIVGSKVKSFPDDNLRIGQSDLLVVEACEHKAAMLNLEPDLIVLTNLEPEHLDYYGSLENIQKNFQQYIDKLTEDGVLVVNGDDVNCDDLKFNGCTITYGINDRSELRAELKKIEAAAGSVGHQIFSVKWGDDDLGEWQLQVPGEFNIYNALAASAAALHLGVKPEIIKEVLAGFPGIWRRFEKVGNNIISDYAHTPTAIKGTIKAAREFYPDKRLVVVFQPHHHDRTKRFFKEFVESFDQADLIIINEIFDVAGREADKDQDVSSKDLVAEIKKRGKQVLYGANLAETKKLILENMQKNDLVLVIGAGDIYKVAEELVKK